MECKSELCKILQLLCTMRLDIRLSQHAADFAPTTPRHLPPASRLLPAYFPLDNASLPRPGEDSGEARGLCGSAVVRLSPIDGPQASAQA